MTCSLVLCHASWRNIRILADVMLPGATLREALGASQRREEEEARHVPRYFVPTCLWARCAECDGGGGPGENRSAHGVRLDAIGGRCGQAKARHRQEATKGGTHPGHTITSNDVMIPASELCSLYLLHAVAKHRKREEETAGTG